LVREILLSLRDLLLEPFYGLAIFLEAKFFRQHEQHDGQYSQRDAGIGK
jgi:hypothetical protein